MDYARASARPSDGYLRVWRNDVSNFDVRLGRVQVLDGRYVGRVNVLGVGGSGSGRWCRPNGPCPKRSVDFQAGMMLLNQALARLKIRAACDNVIDQHDGTGCGLKPVPLQGCSNLVNRPRPALMQGLSRGVPVNGPPDAQRGIQFSEAIQYVVQTTIELGIGAALRRWNRDNDSTVSD